MDTYIHNVDDKGQVSLRVDQWVGFLTVSDDAVFDSCDLRKLAKWLEAMAEELDTRFDLAYEDSPPDRWTTTPST